MTGNDEERMETLAPRETYDTDELGITERLPLYSGVSYGVGMGIFALVESLLDGRSLGRALGSAALMFSFGGLCFGLTFPLLMRVGARRINDRLYAGDWRMVRPPPSGRYTHRLPCAWLRTPNHAVGGVLYLGPGGLRFDPHLRNRARHRESLVMEPLDGMTVQLVHAPLHWRFRVWGHRTIPRIEIRWGDGQLARFGIPDTATVCDRLKRAVADLQRRSHHVPG